MPVISNVVYAATDSTIVATWTTDVSADSNLTADGKAAIDNGVAANSTSHQAIVTGLAASTVYSCIVTSGGTSSSPQNVTTNAARTRTTIASVSFGPSTLASADGDILYNFVSSDNLTYIVRDDAITPGSSANQQIDSVTNETSMAITQVNALANYGVAGAATGTDGPAGATLTNKESGLFGMGGSLYMFCGRHYLTGAIRQQYYGNIIKSNDHGVTWNNFQNTSSFVAGGTPITTVPGPYFFGNLNIGWVNPVRYAVDDGTLGYNTAGNQIDGANGFVYFAFQDGDHVIGNNAYLGRIPRASMVNLDTAAITYWAGPGSPSATDFVDDTNWIASSVTASMTAIYTNTAKVGFPEITFIPALNYYLMMTAYRPSGSVTSNSVFIVLSAPTPAGPWTSLGTQTNNPSGWYSPSVLHRTAATNTLLADIPLKLVYSGDYNNAAYYHITTSTLYLNPSGGRAAGLAVVQTANALNANLVTPTSWPFPSLTITAGNLIVIGVRSGGGFVVTTVTGTGGNVWNAGTVVTAGAQKLQLLWAYNANGFTGVITVNFNGAAAGIAMFLWEISGAALTAAIDQQASGTTAGTSPITSGAYTTTQAQEIICAMATDNGTNATAPTWSFDANLQPGIDSAAFPTDSTPAPYGLAGAAHQIVSAIQTGRTDTAAWTGGAGQTQAALAIATFKALSVQSISGNAGIAGATVNYSGSPGGSVTADGSGNYTIPNLIAATYVITPSKGGYAFTPANSAQTVANADITGVDFTALTVTSIAVNSGNPVSAGTTFSVVVTVSGNVTQNTGVSIATTTGEALGGTTTGTITTGNDAVTFTSMSLSVARTGVLIAATRTSGDFFPTTNSAAFDVVANTVSRANTTALGTQYINTAFSVRVDSTDGFNNSTPVTQDTDIVLAVGNGTGSIAGGTTTGTILSGTSTVTITGVKYDTVENSVTLTATSTSGDSIGPLGVDTAFNVLAVPTSSGGLPVPYFGNAVD